MGPQAALRRLRSALIRKPSASRREGRASNLGRPNLEAPPRHPGTPPWLWWASFALMVTGLLAPILAVPIPPLTDYPNHLARGLFLADGARDAVMQRIFAVHWSIIPNLATDLLLPPLMQMMPPLVAGRLVIALAVLLPSVGAIAVSRLWSGRWSLWSLGAGFVAYNTMFLIGVLNFQIAVGVALWGVACWLALADRSLWLASLTGALFAIGAFICHLFGFAFYALLIGLR